MLLLRRDPRRHACGRLRDKGGGGELLEYAVIAGAISLIAILIISGIAGRIF